MNKVMFYEAVIEIKHMAVGSWDLLSWQNLIIHLCTCHEVGAVWQDCQGGIKHVSENVSVLLRQVPQRRVGPQAVEDEHFARLANMSRKLIAGIASILHESRRNQLLWTGVLNDRLIFQEGRNQTVTIIS